MKRHELNNYFFCITSKPFQAIEINLASAKSFSMVNSEMPITTNHQGVIPSEFIGIDDRTSSNYLEGQIENALCTHILKGFYPQKSLFLQDAENRDFSSSSPSPLSLLSTPKVSFIGLNFPLQPKIPILGVSRDRLSDQVKGIKNRRVRETQWLRGLSCRTLQFKELLQSKPIFGRDSKLLNPSSCKLRKLITTAAITISRTSNSIEFSLPRICTETRVFFPAFFYKKHSSIFKRLKIHNHHYNLVANLL